MTTTHGALFAGYDGIGLALETLFPDLDLSWYSEFDDAPSRIMSHNHPGVPNLGDITEIDWATVPRVKILSGGFPCQDLSLAGRRAGMKSGTRSGLWSHFLTAIDKLRPELVIIENVRGLLSGCAESDLEPCPGCVGDADHRPVLRALGRVLGDLAGIGFDAEWAGVEAATVGAPHKRFREFIVAFPADTDGELFRQFARRALAEEARAHEGHGPSDTRGGGGVPEHLSRTPVADEAGGGPLHPETARERGQTLRLTGQILAMTGDLQAPALTLPTPRASRGASSTETARLLPTPTVSDMNGPGQHGSGGLDLRTAMTQLLPERRFGDYQEAVDRWEAATGRNAPDPTWPSAKTGKPQLSPLFTEWMMGLPLGRVTAPAIWSGSGMSAPAIRNAQLKACGNGVVPQQAAFAIRALILRAHYSLAA